MTKVLWLLLKIIMAMVISHRRWESLVQNVIGQQLKEGLIKAEMASKAIFLDVPAMGKGAMLQPFGLIKYQ
jgi:uncharacterized membrane protein YedE/YeeE